MSRRATTKLYNIPESTLRSRMNSYTTLHERRPTNHNLTELEETVLVRYILDMDERGFTSRLAGMKIWQIIFSNLTEHDTSESSGYIDLYNVVPELKTRFNLCL